MKKQLNFHEINFDETNLANDKIKTALKIFEELKIIETKTDGNFISVREGINFHRKNDLSDSLTYRLLAVEN